MRVNESPAIKEETIKMGECGDLDAIVLDYNTILSTVLERHASLKTKTKVVRPTVPWYSDKIDCARRLRRKAERKWRRTRRTEDLKEFKAKRNYCYLLNIARREYYMQFMEENGSDQGKLFKSANRLLGIKESLTPCFPDHLDNLLLANDVANFLVKKIDNIHSQITNENQ